MLHVFLIFATLQRDPTSIDEFRSIRAFQCDFWGGGAGHVYDDAGGDNDEDRTLTSPPYRYDDRYLIFDSIDYRTLRARSVMKDNPTAVTVIAGDRLVSFLEVSAKGVPIVTSILRTPAPLDRRLGKYYAVRSYQLLITDSGAQSWQTEGSCKARQ
jgi:hypothetical protein